MEKFLNAITTLKIPTLTLVGIFFITGYELLKGSDFISSSGIGGAILLCIGVVLSLILFIDYRYKEQSEHIITQQSKAIDNLGRALKNTSDTHSKIEKSTQAEIQSQSMKGKIGREGGLQYSIEESSETLTK